MYGENFGTSTLADMLVMHAKSVRDHMGDGDPVSSYIDEAESLMQGSMVLWSELMRWRSEDSGLVGRRLLEYRDSPPTRTDGIFEGQWYETGDIRGIIMAPKSEFTGAELLTRLAELMGVNDG